QAPYSYEEDSEAEAPPGHRGARQPGRPPTDSPHASEWIVPAPRSGTCPPAAPASPSASPTFKENLDAESETWNEATPEAQEDTEARKRLLRRKGPAPPNCQARGGEIAAVRLQGPQAPQAGFSPALDHPNQCRRPHARDFLQRPHGRPEEGPGRVGPEDP